MKWTKPHTLESSYGVKLVGWPPEIPFQNPSNNSVESNRLLLQGFKDGRIKFVWLKNLADDPDHAIDESSASPASTSTSSGSDERGVKRMRNS